MKKMWSWMKKKYIRDRMMKHLRDGNEKKNMYKQIEWRNDMKECMPKYRQSKWISNKSIYTSQKKNKTRG